MGSWARGTVTIGVDVVNFFNKNSNKFNIFSREDCDDVADDIRRKILARLRSDKNNNMGWGLDSNLEVVYLPNYSYRNGSLLKMTTNDKDDYDNDDIDRLIMKTQELGNARCSYYMSNIDVPTTMFFNITFTDRHLRNIDVLQVMQDLMYYLCNALGMFVSFRIMNIMDGADCGFVTVSPNDDKVLYVCEDENYYSEEWVKNAKWCARKFTHEMKMLRERYESSKNVVFW